MLLQNFADMCARSVVQNKFCNVGSYKYDLLSWCLVQSSLQLQEHPKMSTRVYIALFALLIAVAATVSAQDDNDVAEEVLHPDSGVDKI